MIKAQSAGRVLLAAILMYIQERLFFTTIHALEIHYLRYTHTLKFD